jgi:hypothetical protein
MEADSRLEELRFRVGGGATDDVRTIEDVETIKLLFKTNAVGPAEVVGTIEGVETTELLFKTYAVVGPAEVVGTIEDVETIELLFRTEGVAMAEEDTELWTN